MLAGIQQVSQTGSVRLWTPPTMVSTWLTISRMVLLQATSLDMHGCRSFLLLTCKIVSFIANLGTHLLIQESRYFQRFKSSG